VNRHNLNKETENGIVVRLDISSEHFRNVGELLFVYLGALIRRLFSYQPPTIFQVTSIRTNDVLRYTPRTGVPRVLLFGHGSGYLHYWELCNTYKETLCIFPKYSVKEVKKYESDKKNIVECLVESRGSRHRLHLQIKNLSSASRCCRSSVDRYNST